MPTDVDIELRREFREKFPEVSNCRNPDENWLQPWAYTDADIKFGKAYRSNDNEIVSSVQLDPWRCDGPNDDGDAFDLQWYLVNRDGRISFIGTDMRLLYAGDYDAGGQSELIFVIDGTISVGTNSSTTTLLSTPFSNFRTTENFMNEHSAPASEGLALRRFADHSSKRCGRLQIKSGSIDLSTSSRLRNSYG